MNDVDLLRLLVGFDSTSSRASAPIFQAVESFLREAGVRVRTWDYAPGKVNLLAWLGPEPGAAAHADRVRDGLTLSGHLDVVPAAEPEWTTDPFTLFTLGGRVQGRGVCDMKGFVAVALNLLRDLARGPAPDRALALLLTSDEEIGSLGAQAFAKSWTAGAPLPRAVIVGEPTSLGLVRMHKGHLKARVTLRGVASHSGMPQHGRSAIEPAGRVITALAALRAELENERSDAGRFFPETPFPTLNIGLIRGGEAVNVIPDRCVIDLGLRLLPGMESAPVVQRVRDAVAGATGGLPAGGATVEVVNDSPPMLLGEDAAIVRRLADLLAQRGTRSVSFASDAGTLQSMGMQCVLLGPGDMRCAHRPNESIEVAELARARRLLERFVRGWCWNGGLA